jgi:hypothetical protein
MKEELSGTGFEIFGDRVNILQIFQVDIIGSPTNDSRLVLNIKKSFLDSKIFKISQSSLFICLKLSPFFSRNFNCPPILIRSYPMCWIFLKLFEAIDMDGSFPTSRCMKHLDSRLKSYGILKISAQVRACSQPL